MLLILLLILLLLPRRKRESQCYKHTSGEVHSENLFLSSWQITHFQLWSFRNHTALRFCHWVVERDNEKSHSEMLKSRFAHDVKKEILVAC